MGNSAEQIQVNPRECRICIEEYDTVIRRPRFLPCGHTFCTDCLVDMLEDNVLTCPNCRAEHKAFGVYDFPVAGIVEDFLMYCSFLEKGTVPEFKPLEIDESFGLCRVMDTLRDEELGRSRTLILSCNEMLSELNRYKKALLRYKTNHQKGKENLQKVLELHHVALLMLDEEIEEVDTLNERGTKKKEVLLSAVNSLLSAETTEEVETAIAKVDDHQHAMEKWFRKCQSVPDSDTICLSVKVRQATSEALETFCGWMDGRILGWMPLADSSKSTSRSELDQRTKEPECLKDITAGLRKKHHHYIKRYQEVIGTDSVKSYVMAGHSVYVVSDYDGRFLFAKTSTSSGSAFMHRLQAEAPDKAAYTIPYCRVDKVMEDVGWKTFLDISWPDSPPRRVIVHGIDLALGFAKSFFMLCTGKQNGHTYINTGVALQDEGDSGERLVFGKGCVQPLTYMKAAPEVPYTDQVGLVHVSLSGQFSITITPDVPSRTAVARVVKGMDVVQEAAEFHDLSKVQVVDCGVVLP